MIHSENFILSLIFVPEVTMFRTQRTTVVNVMYLEPFRYIREKWSQRSKYFTPIIILIEYFNNIPNRLSTKLYDQCIPQY